MANKPSTYDLGATPELYGIFKNRAGEGVIPTESRITVKQPDGTLYTVSGADLIVDTVTSGLLYFVYTPTTRGWYEYEAWGKDGNDREVAQTRGFEIRDRVY